VAQTPPPFHGQAIMQQVLVDANWGWINKSHIRLDFSNDIDTVGKFKLFKLFKLFKIIYKIWQKRLNGKIDLMYYPPSGHRNIPLLRDIFILLFTRWCVTRIVFQFHCSGFDYSRKHKFFLIKQLAFKAYSHPDASIILSPYFRKEIDWIKPKKIYIVENGIPDKLANFREKKSKKKSCKILTVGTLSEKKGLFVSLQAASILRLKKIDFSWKYVGKWASKEFKYLANNYVTHKNLSNYIEFCGEKIGNDKWQAYAEADIFCMPSYYEAQPLVILEAMMFSLPIITTNWGAIPDLITEGIDGYLVPIKNVEKLAEKLEVLIENPSVRNEMGEKAREKYEMEYTLERHLRKIEQVYKEILFI